MTETLTEQPAPAYREATLTPAQVNVIGLPLSLGLFLAGVVAYALVWGPASLVQGLAGLGWWVVPVILAGIVAHELLHGLGWKLAGGLRWSDLHFGMQWKALMPYAHAKVPMRVGPYRLGAALPGIVTGLLPTLAGIALGQPLAAVLGSLFMLAAVGDLMILWRIRRLPPTAQVLDHPTLPGCLVLPDPAA